MPAYYDDQTKSWYCKFYYTDYTGTKKQKKKRGFKLQREAKEWERNFLETQQADLTMSFENFVKIYNEDMRHRLREHTFIQKQYIIDKKLLPFFGKLPVSQISPHTSENGRTVSLLTMIQIIIPIRKPISEPSTTSLPPL